MRRFGSALGAIPSGTPARTLPWWVPAPQTPTRFVVPRRVGVAPLAVRAAPARAMNGGTGPITSSARDRPAGQPPGDRLGGRRTETERYRQAADDALQQLDWCIGYLHGIGKVRISRALARNRSVIRTNLLSRPEQAVPSARTGA